MNIYLNFAEMAPSNTKTVMETSSESPYQLDKSQVALFICIILFANLDKVLKASTALLKHIHSAPLLKEKTPSAQNLLTTGNEDSVDAADAEQLLLNLTAKKHLLDKTRLKPGKISLPHPLYNSDSTSICLITTDPQRSIKDVVAHPLFPASLASRVKRVIGIEKLKSRYKTFESRRQLFSEHNIFLADDRIITLLPRLLGKTFFGTSRRPLPINLTPPKEKDANGKRKLQAKGSLLKAIASPAYVAREVEKTLACTQVQLSQSASVSIRVGLSTFTASQVAENVEAVVNGMVSKFVPKGWKNIRSIHIKGISTSALPIWQAQELWLEETDILEETEAKEAQLLKSQKGRKRKERVEQKEGNAHKKAKMKAEGADMSTEMTERRRKLSEQIKEAKQAADTLFMAPKDSVEGGGAIL